MVGELAEKKLMTAPQMGVFEAVVNGTNKASNRSMVPVSRLPYRRQPYHTLLRLG